MVQNPENPYDIRFGPKGEHLVPPHIFSRTDYVELASFLDSTPCTVLYMMLTESHFNPHTIRNLVLRDIGYFKGRFEELLNPLDAADFTPLLQIAESGEHALRRAAILYEPLEEIIAYLGTENDAAVLWRLRRAT